MAPEAGQAIVTKEEPPFHGKGRQEEPGEVTRHAYYVYVGALQGTLFRLLKLGKEPIFEGYEGDGRTPCLSFLKKKRQILPIMLSIH